MSEILEVERFWDNRPCNIRHSKKPVGSRVYFDEVERRKYFIEPHIPSFAQFKKWKGKKVLEIGCGIGTDAVNFVRAGAKLTATEISGKTLEVCRKRFWVYNLPARFYLGNAEKLSFFVPEEKYDLIYSFGVIHYTPRPERAISEIKKYCGPRTEVKIMLYSKWSFKVLWIIFKFGKGAFWRVNELVPEYSEAQTGCPVTWCYSLREIRRLLPGFKIIEIRKEHIFPYKIFKYIKYQYEKMWYFRLMPQSLSRCLERI